MKSPLFVSQCVLLCLAISASGQNLYEFSDGRTHVRLRLEPEEALVRRDREASTDAVLKAVKKVVPGAALDSLQGDQILLRIPAGARRKLAQSRPVSPVLYDLTEEGTPAQLALLTPDQRRQRRIAARRIPTAKVLVRMPDHDEISARIRAVRPPESEQPSAAAGYYTLTYASPSQALEAARWMVEEAHLDAMPLFARQQFSKQAAAPSPYSGPLQRVVNDPLYPREWHLGAGPVNLGMNAAWDYTTGAGVNVAVVDDGLQVNHPDLKNNVYPLSSNYNYNFNGGAPGDPTPDTWKSAHGTSCGGIIAATAFNNLGVAGVAPDAKLMGLRLIAGPATDEDEARAYAWQPDGIVTHVSSNSWGPSDDAKTLGRPGVLTQAAFQQAATQNRNGLGTVIVVAAGNGRDAGDVSSYDMYTSNRNALSVCAVNSAGQQSSYSESGVNLALCGLGGEFAPPDVIVTTNTLGAEANQDLIGKGGDAPVDYTDSFNGTSAATPMVAGAAALLLSRNPQLSARDVKEILIASANRAPLTGGDPFATNSGGFSFSHSFGAGLLNVSGALTLADTWKSLPPQKSTQLLSQTLRTPIPEGDAGVLATWDVPDSLRVEEVEFTVSISHPNRGDLSFVLTSPSGMQSIVPGRAADDGADFENFTFTSVRHYGENSQGTWKLNVLDQAINGQTGVLKSAALQIYGAAPR